MKKIKNMKNVLLSSLIVISALFSSTVFSTQVNQAQIEQFKKLSGNEQQSIAKQFGVDISSSTTNSKPTNQGAYVAETQYTTPIIYRDIETNEAVDVNEEFKPLEYTNEDLKPYGYEVFSNVPTTFAPISNVAIPEGYILGVGDVLSLQIFGKENFQYDLAINREGNIVIPDLGPYLISGLSFSEMKRFLLNKIKERIIGVDAVIGLSHLRSIRVFVLGDAYRPGPYTISSLSSISHAIFAAGGINNIGSLRKIQIKRAGKLVQTFDLYDLLIKGDSSKDILLKSGDVVFIEPKGKTVTVSGEVRRPAIYEILNNTEINEIVDIAGGVLPSAYLNLVKVERFDEKLRTILSLDLSNVVESATTLLDGDVINVMKKTDMFTEFVTVLGSVARNGKFQWKPGMKISDLINNINTDLVDGSDLEYSLLLREKDIARNIDVYQFSLVNILSDVNSPDNLELTPRDSLLIFNKYKSSDTMFNKGEAKGEAKDEAKDVSLKKSRRDLLKPVIERLSNQSSLFQPVQVFDIAGAVKFPGSYPLPNNARVKDLIIAAGGITDSAYLPRADITRNNVFDSKASTENIQISLMGALNNIEKDNIKIESRDRIYIHQIPSWKDNQYVELKGEFVFPGKYTIQRGESLSDLIERAGGFTEFAHIKGSVFTRLNLKELEKENLDKLLNTLKIELASKSITEGTTIGYGETQQLLTDLTNLEPLGRLVIDLDKTLNSPDYKVTLEDGDVLYVPEYKNSVNVIGQVQVTASHVFEPSISIDNYISRSGGIKQRADEERMYIVSANGSISMLNQGGWFSNNQDTLMPGDTIVVPLNSDYTSNLKLWSTATELLYKSAIAVAAINGL